MEKIIEWLKDNGSGDGSGYGSGSGSCSGDGFGYGDGYGDGSGDGSGFGYGSSFGSGDSFGFGYGSGSGSGDGSGIAKINGMIVAYIDAIPTLIKTVKGNLAKGYILHQDMTITPCYVAKSDGLYAHDETLAEAREALREKIMSNMNTDEAITEFLKLFKAGVRYTGAEFYQWHHYLTGSCEQGRKSFVRDRGLSVDATYTVDEFIEICEDAYGQEIIQKLKEKYYANQS